MLFCHAARQLRIVTLRIVSLRKKTALCGGDTLPIVKST